MSLRRYAPAAAIAVLAACGPGQGQGDRPGSADGITGPVLVSAAASLSDAFRELAVAFESAHPGTDVVLNLAGSSALRRQIVEGAPVDVFASADAANMAPLEEAGLLAAPPVVLARNSLRIAVPAGNPGKVRSLSDFAREPLRLGLCADEVPCGALAAEAFRRAAVTPVPDTREPNVRALLAKIALGELDAGIVYATDLAAVQGEVEGIEIPADFSGPSEQMVAVLTGAPNGLAAEAFLAFVLSPDGQAVLRRHGFSLP